MTQDTPIPSGAIYGFWCANRAEKSTIFARIIRMD